MKIKFLASSACLPLLASAAVAQTTPPSPAEPTTSAAVSPQQAPRRAVHHKGHPASPALRRVAAANRSATQEPAVQGFINAVQVYPYADGALYKVYTAPERVTDIALQRGEVLGAVASGDTVRWVIGDTTSGTGADKRTHILVKPFAAGLSTNLVITTDRRAYHLSLTSTSGAAMAALSWTYPQDQLIALRRAAEERQAAAPISSGLVLEQLHFNYEVTGDRPTWRPFRAFDDGRQTFIEFPASIAVGEAPPLFIIDGWGRAQLVNYRVRGRFYIVDRIFNTAELRLGTKRPEIVRITRVAVGGQRRRDS
jgi:type IV secretion system protein TrbG